MDVESTDVADSTESEATESFDMEEGLDTISNDLFGKSDDDFEESDEVEEIEAKPEEKPEEPIEVKKQPPESWKKEMHETFHSLPKEAQEYIEQREEQMRSGLDVNKNDSNLGRTVRDIMSPYEKDLQEANIEPSVMIKNLMGAHYKLSTSSPEEKAQIMQQLAQSYGVEFSGQGVKPVDPIVVGLQKEVNSLKYSMSQREQAARQEAMERTSKEVNEFAESHEYFDDVSDQLLAFINTGDTLEEAYEKAVWANPITRQKELDRTTKEKSEAEMKAKMEKVRAAKKAKSTNVNSRGTGKSPTGFSGSMEDTIRDTYRDIQNRT